MPKLIVNPNECAHQSQAVHVKKGERMVPLCTHPRMPEYEGCTNSRDFPKNARYKMV